MIESTKKAKNIQKKIVQKAKNILTNAKKTWQNNNYRNKQNIL